MEKKVDKSPSQKDSTTSKKYKSKLRTSFSPHKRNLGIRVEVQKPRDKIAESLKTKDLGSLRQNLKGNFETEISKENPKTEDLGGLRQNLRGNFETEISKENPKTLHLGILRHHASEGTD